MYTEEDHWDCLATCFFIDCANNIVQFIETIYKILKPGGTWINLGPLLYHFSDMPMEDSIEPSYSEIRDVITGLGFQITVCGIFFFFFFISTIYTHVLTHGCITELVCKDRLAKQSIFIFIIYKFYYRKKRLTWKRDTPKIRIVCCSTSTTVFILFAKNQSNPMSSQWVKMDQKAMELVKMIVDIKSNGCDFTR